LKRSSFIILFIGAQVSFIFLQIHKHAQFIKQSFIKQKNERIKENLDLARLNLEIELNTLKNQSLIKKIAQEKLHLKPIRLNQVKRLPNHGE